MGETFPAGSRPFLAVAPSGACPKAKKNSVLRRSRRIHGAAAELRSNLYITPTRYPVSMPGRPGTTARQAHRAHHTAQADRQDPPGRGQTRSIQRRDHRRSAVRLSFFPSLSLERPGAACGKCRTRQNPRKRSMKMLLRTPAAAPRTRREQSRIRSFFLTFGPARQKRNGPEKGKSPRGKDLSHRDLSRRTGYPHVNSFRPTAQTCRAAGPYRFTPANFAVFEYAFTTQRPEVPS